MQQDILINWAPHESRVAVVENGAVQEVHIERSLERGLVGNIYLGKVVRVLPGMQSAFIDIGLERSAFLHVADLMSSVSAKHAEPDATQPTVLPIEKQVFEGQSMLVQVMKDPLGSKGARLSAQLSIAGRLLVFLPQDDHIGVSQKIPLEQRHLLRDRLSQLAHQGEAKGGFILRTNGEEATDAELSEDIAYLRKTWERIRLASVNQAAKSLLHQDLNLLQRVLRDFVTEGTQTIRIDSGEQFSMLKAFGEEFMPSSVGKLVHYKGERPIFDLFNIDADIQSALGRRVELKSGGYLIIDQTEAMATVDVNTGGFVGAKSFDETIFKTNLEAADFNTEVNSIVEINTRYKYFVAYLSDNTNSYLLQG
jgi:ribonuclease G